MILFKSLFSISMLLSAAFDGGWVNVPRTDRAPQQLEETDPSIWVVFAKTFGEERVLVRFPTDPSYQKKINSFTATSGDLTLIVEKKGGAKGLGSNRELVYPDPEDSKRWIQEKHIETDEYRYVLRVSTPNLDPFLLNQFANSFEIERNQDFRR